MHVFVFHPLSFFFSPALLFIIHSVVSFLYGFFTWKQRAHDCQYHNIVSNNICIYVIHGNAKNHTKSSRIISNIYKKNETKDRTKIAMFHSNLHENTQITTQKQYILNVTKKILSIFLYLLNIFLFVCCFCPKRIMSQSNTTDYGTINIRRWIEMNRGRERERIER